MQGGSLEPEELDDDRLVGALLAEGRLSPTTIDSVREAARRRQEGGESVSLAEVLVESGLLGASEVERYRVGNRFGGYRLDEVLGQGGMGIVFKAWDPELRRHVALKKLLPHRADPRQLERCLREARAAARFRHPNVLQVFDVGCVGNQPYFTMEYVDARPIGEVLPPPAPPRPVSEALRSVARALHAAHRSGVVHRDVKPANILVDAAGRPWITDFGIAWQVGGSEKRPPARTGFIRTGPLVGTPEYLGPELVDGVGEPGPPSDQFALGVVLYELLTGVRPFAGDTPAEVFDAISESDPVPPGRLRPDLPADLETIVLAALDKDPRRRYPDLGALADDLDRWLADEPIAARRVRGTRRLIRRALRRPAESLQDALLGAIAIGLAVWAMITSMSPTRVPPRPEPGFAVDLSRGREVLDRALADLSRPEAEPEDLRRHLAEARTHFERALTAAPADDETRWLLGRTWEALGELTLAEAEWSRTRNHPPARLALGRLALARALLACEPCSGACEPGPRVLALAAAAAAELEPFAEHGPLEKASLAAARRDWPRAIEFAALGTAGNEAPDHDLLCLTGQVEAIRGDLDAARAALDRAVDARRHGALALHARGVVRSRQGDDPGAIADLGRSIDLWPAFAWGHARRAESLARTGDLDAAREDAESALRLDPREPAFHLILARILIAAGEVDAATKSCDRALELAPDDPTALHERGACHLAAGRRDLAAADLQAALDALPPDDPRRAPILERLDEARR